MINTPYKLNVAKFLKSMAVLVCTSLLIFLSTPAAQALSQDQRNQFKADIDNFDVGFGELTSTCPSGPLSGENNAIAAYNYLAQNLELTAAQASGIIGNLMNESGGNGYDLNPEVVGQGMCANGSDCHGIAQWSEARWASLEAWAQGQGLDPLALEAQVGYIVEELTNVPGHWSVTLGNLQAISGDTEQAARDAAAEFNDTYEVGVNTPQRQLNAARFFREHAQSAGPPQGSEGDTGCPSNFGEVECPENLEAHPTRQDYFRMPEAPNDEYIIYSRPEARFGSQELVCALYTVALGYYQDPIVAGRSRLRIGDLNAAGHASHNIGIAVDLSGFGELQTASWTASWEGTYSEEGTVMLGERWVDTGMLMDIWWCPPDAQNDNDNQGSSQVAIREYAGEDGLLGLLQCEPGHSDHFHVNISNEFQLEFWEP